MSVLRTRETRDRYFYICPMHIIEIVMADLIQAVAGLFLVGFSFIIFIYALPTLSDITTTGVGTTWENSSSVVVSAIGTSNTLISIMPFITFFIGLGLVIKGLGG